MKSKYRSICLFQSSAPQRRRQSRRLGASCLLALAVTAPQALAVDYTWLGATGDWLTTTNWSPTGTPGTADNVLFNTTGNTGGVYTPYLGTTAQTVTSLTFDGANLYNLKLYDVDGTTSRALTVGNITVTSGSHTITGATPSNVAGPLTLNFGTYNIAAGSTLSFNVRVVGGSANNYFKTGAGTLVLAAGNGSGGGWQIGSGVFAVNEGTLKATAVGAFGNSGNKFTVADGATLDLAAGYGTSTLTLNGTGMSGIGAAYASETTSIALASNSVVLGSATSIGVAATKTLTISSPITGAYPLTKTGSGTLTLSSILNTYTGDTIVTTGTLSQSVNNALPDTTAVRIPSTGTPLNLTYTGGDAVDSLYIDGVKQVTGSYGSLTSTATNKISQITGAGLLNVTAASSGGIQYTWNSSSSGDWSIPANWTTNDATPTVPDSSDNVVLNTSGNTGNIYTVFLGAAASSPLSLTFDGANPYNLRLFDSATGTTISRTLTVGNITVTSGSHTITGATPTSGAGTLVMTGGAISVASGSSLTFNSRLAGTATSYIKTGTGTLVLGGGNGNSGAWQVGIGFTVSEGTLKLAVAAAAGNSVNKFTVATGATMDLAASYGSSTLTLNGTGVGDNGAVYASATTSITGTSVVLGSASSIGVANTKTLTISAPISGAFSLTKSGSGALTLTGINTYSGTTAVNAGALTLDFTALAGNAGNQSNHIASSSILQLGGTTLSVKGVGTGSAITAAAWTGATTSGLLTFLAASNFTGVVVGQAVTGTGIPAGAYVVSIDAANKRLTISANATATSGTFTTTAATPLTSQTFAGTTLNQGASAVSVNANAGGGTALTLGAITRNPGSTVDFTNPSGTLAATNGIQTITGTASSFLSDSGVAYATVGGTDWAAKDATNAWMVGLSSISGGYSPSTATVLAGNADISTGIDTALGTSPALTSLRFNQPQATTITATGQTLTTGGILVTAAVGNNPSTLIGGTLMGAAGKELVVIQNNPSNALTIASVIANNTSATGLTKSGSGTLSLTGHNTYSGDTTVNQGTLSITTNNTLANAAAVRLPASGATLNLAFTGPDAVTAFYIDGVAQATGTWGAIGSSAAHPTALITGSGLLNVTNGVVSENYDSWAADNGVLGGPNGDSDNDGIPNLIEYALADGPAGTFDRSTNKLTFTKRGAAITNGDVSWTIEASTTLLPGSWTSVATQPAGDTNPTIEYIFNPAALPKQFARINVMQAP